jgi:hypothetical protein
LKDRLITLGLALCALLLFWALFLPKPQPPQAAPPAPLSTEERADGYLAAWRWLAAERVREMAWHERFDRLAEAAALAAAGNVLLTTLPNQLPIGAREATRLDAWVERGNTLVVLAALDDTPAWSIARSALLTEEIARVSRLKFEAQAPRPPEARQAFEAALAAWQAPRDSVIEPNGAQPLLEGVRTLEVSSDLPASRWRATPMDTAAVLDLAELSGSDASVMWLRRQGRGQVITLAFAGIFANGNIGRADNGRLLSNIVAWALQPGGAVIFDDAHQGAVSFYDAKAFFADARLHRTLAWLILLWLVFVLGVQRARVRAQQWRAAEITAFIATSGEFFASMLSPPTAAARLLENFFSLAGAPHGANQSRDPDWNWLAAHASVSSAELVALRESHQRAQAGRRVDLVKLQNLLHELRGKLR